MLAVTPAPGAAGAGDAAEGAGAAGGAGRGAGGFGRRGGGLGGGVRVRLDDVLPGGRNRLDDEAHSGEPGLAQGVEYRSDEAVGDVLVGAQEDIALAAAGAPGRERHGVLYRHDAVVDGDAALGVE